MFERLNAVARSKGLPERENWALEDVPDLALPEDFFANVINDLIVDLERFAAGFEREDRRGKNLIITRNLTEFSGNQRWICNEVNNIYRAGIFTDYFFCRTMLAAAWNNGNARIAAGERMTVAERTRAINRLNGREGLRSSIMKIELAMGAAIGGFRELQNNPKFCDNLAVRKMSTTMARNMERLEKNNKV